MTTGSWTHTVSSDVTTVSFHCSCGMMYHLTSDRRKKFIISCDCGWDIQVGDGPGLCAGARAYR